MAAFAKRAEQAGLAETAEAPDRRGATQLHFWMPDSARQLVLGRLEPRERDYQLARVASAVQEALKSGAYAQPVVVAWADAAAGAAGPDASTGEALNRRIQALADQGDTGRALDVIEAVSSLAPVVGQEYSSVVARGTRRISLEYRRASNERALKTFLPRAEQIDDFERLLTGPETDWALHYVGVGGVGKTMLVRYLTTRFGPDTGRGPFPVARVDFDHVSPLYPGERPGQLLLELADELAAHAGTRRQDQLLVNLVDSVTSLHEAAQQRQVPADAASPELRRALDAFARFIGALPQPVVFFFDTCEELAKFHPPGQEAPGITATFLMLSELRERHNELRVVFAGRRLLAAGGPVLPDVGAGRPAAVSAVERKYLRVHEIRGFTRREATNYLTKIRRCPADRSGLLEALLDTSREVGMVAGRRDPLPDREERYNPYDLALGADVLEQRPDLDAQTVRSRGSDLYVQLRIIERLADDSELLASLPVAVLLGRFDRAMLECALESPSSMLFDRIAEQEWCEETLEHESDTVFLSVQPRLRERLDAHYARTEPIRYASLKRAVGLGLRDLIAAQPLRRLRSDHFLAALRFLEPAEAARLWDETAQRICAEEAWEWSYNVCTVLLSDEGPAGAPGSPLRAGVQACYIGALLHEGRSFDAVTHWRSVEESAPLYANEEAQPRLRVRAVLGGVTALLQGGGEVSASNAASLITSLLASDEIRAQTDPGAMVAALDALLDNSSETPGPDAVAKWAWDLSPREQALSAHAATLAGRCMARADRGGESPNWFELAEQRAGNGSSGQVWNDWVAPSDVRARVRLERLRIPAARSTSSDPWQWVDEVKTDLTGIEAERLVAAVVSDALDRRPIETDRLAELEQLDTYEPGRQPLCAAHRVTPPLFVALARGWLARGEAGRALELLERREREATGTRVDPATVTAAHLGLIQAARRLREPGRFQSLIGRYAYASNPENPELTVAAREALAVISPQAPPAGTYDDLHSWWRIAPALSPQEALVALARVEEPGVRGSPNESPELLLDCSEARLIARRLGDPERAGRLPGLSPEAWESARSSALTAKADSEPNRSTRLALRFVALTAASPFDWEPLSQELESVPRRLLAELALEEGELLALRLPTQAALLLLLASYRFADADDPSGPLTSTILAVECFIQAGDLDSANHLWQTRALPARERWVRAVEDRGPWSNWEARFRDCSARLETARSAGGEPAPPPASEPSPSATSAPTPSASAPAAPATAPGRPAARRGSSQRLVRAAEGALGIAAALGVSVGLGALVNLGLGAINSSLEQGIAIATAIGVGVLGLLGWLIQTSASARRWALARWFTLRVTILGREHEATATLRATLVTAPMPWLIAKGVFRAVVRPAARPLGAGVEGRVTGLEHDATALVPPPGALLPIAALGAFSRDARLGVELRVAPSLAGHPWERMLAGVAAGPPNDGALADVPRSFAFRRLVTPLVPVLSAAQPAAPRQLAAAAVGIVAGPAWLSAVERQWDRGFRADWMGRTRVMGIDPSTAYEVPVVGLLHLIGVPTYTPTTGEWQLRIDGGTSADELEAAQRSATTGVPQQILISPDRLPAQARYLVVIEDEPSSLAGDPVRANGLRMLAAEAAAAGIPVITLPALPPEVAFPAVGKLAAIWREAPKPESLEAMTSTIQELIAASAEASDLEEAGTSPGELALEVTLFMPDTRPFSTHQEP